MYTQKTNKCTLRHTNTDASAVCTLALCNTANFDIGPIPNKCRANITDTNTDTDTFYHVNKKGGGVVNVYVSKAVWVTFCYLK